MLLFIIRQLNTWPESKLDRKWARCSPTLTQICCHTCVMVYPTKQIILHTGHVVIWKESTYSVQCDGSKCKNSQKAVFYIFTLWSLASLYNRLCKLEKKKKKFPPVISLRVWVGQQAKGIHTVSVYMQQYFCPLCPLDSCITFWCPRPGRHIRQLVQRVSRSASSGLYVWSYTILSAESSRKWVSFPSRPVHSIRLLAWHFNLYMYRPPFGRRIVPSILARDWTVPHDLIKSVIWYWWNCHCGTTLMSVASGQNRPNCWAAAAGLSLWPLFKYWLLITHFHADAHALFSFLVPSKHAQQVCLSHLQRDRRRRRRCIRDVRPWKGRNGRGIIDKKETLFFFFLKIERDWKERWHMERRRWIGHCVEKRDKCRFLVDLTGTRLYRRTSVCAPVFFSLYTRSAL